MSSDAHLGGDDMTEPLSDVPRECYDVLRHPRRLRILQVLGSGGARLSLPKLTAELTDRTETNRPAGQARHAVRISLVHNHLPRLEEYEIIDWDDDGVELVDESPVHPADITALLELCETDHAEQLLETIVDPVRMRLLAVLEDDRPLSLEQLAARLSAYDGGPFSDSDRAEIELHHSHLPAMADVGVISYDHESGLVTRYDDVASIVQ